MSSCAAPSAACCCRAPKRACRLVRSTAPKNMPGSGRGRADAGAAALPGAVPRAARAHARLVLDLARLLQPLPHHGSDAVPVAVVGLRGRAQPGLALAPAVPRHL